MVLSALIQTEAIKLYQWLLNPAYTRHMTIDCTNFYSFVPAVENIQMGNRATIQSLGSGLVAVNTLVKEVKHTVVLKDVLYVPNLI